MRHRPVTRPSPLTAYQRKQPPADMLLVLLEHRAAVGQRWRVSIELRPAPGHRYWVEVEDDRERLHTSPRPLSPREAVAFARRFGVDAHNLTWEPDDCGPATTTNPFAE